MSEKRERAPYGGLTAADREDFAVWLSKELTAHVGRSAVALQGRTGLSIRTCERLLGSKGGADLGTILCLLRTGLLAGADLEGYATGREPGRQSAREGARALYDALVEEIVAAPPAELLRLRVNDPDPAKRRETVRARLGFPAAHVENMERGFFWRTLEMRVGDSAVGVEPSYPEAIYTTLVTRPMAPMPMGDWESDFEAVGKLPTKRGKK